LRRKHTSKCAVNLAGGIKEGKTCSMSIGKQALKPVHRKKMWCNQAAQQHRCDPAWMWCSWKLKG
jgi:hypothetical protein